MPSASRRPSWSCSLPGRLSGWFRTAASLRASAGFSIPSAARRGRRLPLRQQWAARDRPRDGRPPDAGWVPARDRARPPPDARGAGQHRGPLLHRLRAARGASGPFEPGGGPAAPGRRLRWSEEDRRLHDRHRWRSEGFRGEARTWRGLGRAVQRGLGSMRTKSCPAAAAISLKRLAAAFLRPIPCRRHDSNARNAPFRVPGAANRPGSPHARPLLPTPCGKPPRRPVPRCIPESSEGRVIQRPRYGPGPRISMQASGKHQSAVSTGRTHESARPNAQGCGRNDPASQEGVHTQ